MNNCDYSAAQQRYAAIGISTEEAINTLAGIPVSMHCWQGDDVSGFENSGSLTDGGIMATGGYPGKARNADELRTDMETAFKLIPGKHRVNLHAIYAETGGNKVDRNELSFEHFKGWAGWAAEQKIGIDFNPTFFAHPKAADGFTLAHRDPAVRRFWIEHASACRNIARHFGETLGKACVCNVWIPDGYKDIPADRKTPRLILEESLDEIFAREIDPALMLDSVESKLFGIGTESYVVGSHEFYLGYAVRNNKLLCLDSGHFHPTETIEDKLSAVLCFIDEVLLHVSRGVRWDSDHVITLDDPLIALAREIVWGGFIGRVHIGLDFFDASINRVAAWVIGMRNMQKALLQALLAPAVRLRDFEQQGRFTERLALLEECKTMPWIAVWEEFCERNGVPAGAEWINAVMRYEQEVLLKR